jgi:hypothetical protein
MAWLCLGFMNAARESEQVLGLVVERHEATLPVELGGPGVNRVNDKYFEAHLE